MLILVVLFPTLATAVLIVSDASSLWSYRQNAKVVASEATELQTVAQARAELNEARVPAMAISFAESVGMSPTTLDDLLNADYVETLASSAQNLATNPTFSSTPTLHADLQNFENLVPGIQDNTVPYTTVENLSTKFASDVDNLWYSDYDKLEDTVARWQPPGSFEVHVAALRQTYAAFLNGGYEIEGAIYVLEGQGGVPAKKEVIESSGVFAAATSQFRGHLGPEGQLAWNSLENNAANKSFEATLDEAVNVALNGGTPPFAAHVGEAGVAETNGLNFLRDLNALVRAASADLHNAASTQASAATSDFVREILFLVLLAGVCTTGVVIAAQSLSGPLQKLAAAARKISDGDFDLGRLADQGPREVVATNAAFNDMASTLKAVEAKTVALAAEDLAHPELQVPLPGRTGKALQATVDALATRIRERELQRQELEQAATHDRLTGVLNRAAIFDYLTHDVARRRRAGETVAVLFVDLDGLKPLNDTFGHEVGDRAIVTTAQALLEATEDCDLVGRLGGDEFLIILCAAHSQQGMDAAERIRQTVSCHSVSARGSVVPLRCSVGVALTECDTDTDPMELVHRADQAMYEAKRAAHAAREQRLEQG
jgi:diguanylate cyclase (GGDEF)-like protein